MDKSLENGLVYTKPQRRHARYGSLPLSEALESKPSDLDYFA
ncbi:hypothetical protein QUF54_01515 [Candidatus Marithioploca araucensis]|uniref:Uncharacterized protein n=1 Tax=Candidatus Marithioploca araucensis TaxID=70273 RepID=A0ABT7VQS3_9GAMM|nr:hypothetical protein [Candidatus Marithioploca araucensis]